MRSLRWWRRIAALGRSRRLDRELDAEIRLHLQLAEDEARRNGLSPDEARRLARIQFGGIEAVKAEHREVRSASAVEAWWRDARHASRALRRAPGFTATAILLLALGVGGHALALGAVRGLLIRPLPHLDADRLVWVQSEHRATSTATETITSIEANALARRPDLFDAVAVIGPSARVHLDGGRRQQWVGLWVSPSLTRVLDVVAVHGRSFDHRDMGGGPDSPMMLGYERWRQDFGGDPSIVGRVLPFGDRKAHTVIGVLPPGLEFPVGRPPAPGNGSGFAVGLQDFWILGQDRPDEYPGGLLIARPREGVTPAKAAAPLALLSSALAREHQDLGGRTLALISVRDHALGSMRQALPLLEAFAILVLLVATANLGSLMLARRTTARAEVLLRTALGARTSDIVRLRVSECAWLAFGGVMTALGLAWLGRQAVRFVAAGHMPMIDRLTIDPVTVATSIGITVVIAAACMFGPDLLTGSTRRGLLEAPSRTQTIDRRLGRILDSFVVAQVALTLVLLAGAALVFQSLTRLLAVDTGYARQQVVVADVLLFEPPSIVVPVFSSLYDRLRGLPGVEAVGLIQSTPLTGKWTFREPFLVEGRAPDSRVRVDIPGSFVAFDYFEAMSIPVIDGRTFTRSEFTASKLPTIVINDVAAERFFPGERAVGRRVHMFGEPREIVGVVKGTRDVRLDVVPEPQWYQPIFFGDSQVLVRTSGSPATAVDTLRRELMAADPRLIVKRVEPLDAIVKASIVERRLATATLSAFAGLALVLAIVGLYGVMHFRTLQRRREFAVRTVLGATRGALVRGVVGHGLLLGACGLIIGGLIAVPASKGLQGLLFEIPPGDPATIVAVSLLLLGATLAACARPAWKASSIEPTIVLRSE